MDMKNTTETKGNKMQKFEWTREEVIAKFEEVTVEKASDYPTATTMDFWIWTKEAREGQRNS